MRAVHFLLVLSLFCHCLVSAQFNLTLFNASLPFEQRVDSVIVVTRAPMAFTNAASAIGIAPAGSWLLYGTQSDVWLTSNNGATWNLLAGQSGNKLPGLDYNTWATTGSGNSGCAHRTTFNRFYWMGISNQNSAAVATNGTFFNYVSTDGQEWIQIMDAASVTQMSARQASEFGICVVDKYERVYSILGADTWMSSNLGVTWSAVSASSYFPVRQDHSGVIYTPTGSVESVVIMAGRGWTPATSYGAEMNDVWITTNYGQSWQAQTMAAPWYPRENPNVVVAQNGVIAMNGGNLCGGYGCGSGPYINQGWLSDAWASFDNGKTWTQLAASSNSLFAQAATITDSNGYWYTIAGQTGPANNTNYAWTNSGYRSSFSLTSITSWGPSANVTIPSSFSNTMLPYIGLCPNTVYTGGCTMTSSSSSSSSSLTNGAIAGIVIGSVVGAAVLLCVCYAFVVLRGRERKDRDMGKQVDTMSPKGKFTDLEESQTGGENVEMH